MAFRQSRGSRRNNHTPRLPVTGNQRQALATRKSRPQEALSRGSATITHAFTLGRVSGVPQRLVRYPTWERIHLPLKMPISANMVCPLNPAGRPDIALQARQFPRRTRTPRFTAPTRKVAQVQYRPLLRRLNPSVTLWLGTCLCAAFNREGRVEKNTGEPADIKSILIKPYLQPPTPL